MEAYVTRRELLRVACALAGVMALSACGASAPSAPSNAPSSTPPSASVVASAAAPAASQSGAALPSITFAFVTRSATTTPLWLAEATDAFSKAGVKVNSTFTQSAVAIPAIIAKETDAVLISGAPVITADLNGNADLVYVASLLNHPTISVYAQPSIKSPGDLKGKTLSSDRPGTPDDYGMRVALRLMGLSPSDVTMLQLGSVANYSALTSGQVQAATLSPPYSFRAEAQGFPKIKDLSSEQYQNVGVVVSKARIPALNAALPGLLAGLRQGITVFNDQPDLAKQVMGKNMDESDSQILDKTYQTWRDSAPFELSLRPTLDGLQTMIDFLSDTVPAAKSAKADQFVDTRFLN